MFSPPVAESLALVLQNQRDRFMLDFYDGYHLESPHTQATNHLIWRTVINHIAYQNQRYNNSQWQMLFHEENLIVSQAPYIPSHIDHVVHRLLAGYHGLPFYVVPSSRIYETTNASTYDTLQPTYVHREHAMSPQRLSPQSGHPAFPSYTELRATMLLRQIPQPPPPLQTWPIDHNYLQFQLSPTMSVLETAQFTRTHGPVYNLLTLYTVHN